MAVIYDFFGKNEPYDSEVKDKNDEAAYKKHLRDQMNDVLEYMEIAAEQEGRDPLRSIVLIPCKQRAIWTICSLRADDTTEDLVEALTAALSKVKEFE